MATFVVFVVTGDVDDRASEGLVCPCHPLTAHRNVSSEYNQVCIDLGRLEALEFQMQI
ncbi:hypothetical protein D3C80_2154370 [compost metagenome]